MDHLSESATTAASRDNACRKCTAGQDSLCTCAVHTEGKKVEAGNSIKANDAEQQRHSATTDLRLEWFRFNRALRSPEPFDQFHWIRALGASSVRYLYHVSKLSTLLERLNVRNIWRPIIPVFGIGLVVLVVASYFLTLRESIVVRRWCDCTRASVGEEIDSPDKECEEKDYMGDCAWLIAHNSTVVYIAIMILWNFVRTTFISPGVVVPPGVTSSSGCGSGDGLTHASKTTDIAKAELSITPRWTCAEGRGGCCFIDPVLDIAAEQKVVALYGKMIMTNDKGARVRDTVMSEAKYFPSPEATYCIKCHQPRPPRCHHCNSCNRCILQYDHHCPWVNNCIGYGNYRLFLLTVFYLAVGCCYGVGLLAGDFFDTMSDQLREHGFKILYGNKTGLLDLPPPWVLWEQATTTGIDPDVIVRMVFPLLFLVGIILVTFLISHMRYIASGYTTLEQTVVLGTKLAYRKAQLEKISHKQGRDASARVPSYSIPTNPFHQSWARNIVQILGPVYLVFLPIPVAPPAPFVPKVKAA